jgi:hypothetical protein
MEIKLLAATQRLKLVDDPNQIHRLGPGNESAPSLAGTHKLHILVANRVFIDGSFIAPILQIFQI